MIYILLFFLTSSQDEVSASDATPRLHSDTSSPTHQTALHHQAVSSNNHALFQQLLESGADITTSMNTSNQTALHVACRTPGIHLAIVTDMVDMGCDLGLRDSEGSTCMHYACASGNVGLVSILLRSATCPVNAQDNAGMTPLMVAASRNLPAIVTQLVENRKTRLDTRDERGWTALHWAVSC